MSVGAWALTILLTVLHSTESAAREEPNFEWKGKSYPVTAPPLGFDPRLLAAVKFWSEFAVRYEYRLLLEGNPTVLLLLPERAKPDRFTELLARTQERCHVLLPEPNERVAEGASSIPPGFSSEDIFGEEEGGKGKTQAAASLTWGRDEGLDEGAIVLAVFRKPDDYGKALELLAKDFEYLRGWVPDAKSMAGCVLVQPLFGACVENMPGMEEWSLDNEVVHRLAELHLVRRFSAQPLWVLLGVGWNVEFDVLKSVYCFPYRDGFVSVLEHGAWDVDLKNMFKNREKKFLKVSELSGCKRGKYDAECAALSYGMIRFLAAHRAEQLPQILEEFRAARNTLGKKSTSKTDWIIEAGYEIPELSQEEILKRLAGKDVLKEATEWFRLGQPEAHK